MQLFFQELYSHIDKNSGEKFEEMFLVKIASKGNLLKLIFKLKLCSFVSVPSLFKKEINVFDSFGVE